MLTHTLAVVDFSFGKKCANSYEFDEFTIVDLNVFMYSSGLDLKTPRYRTDKVYRAH